MYRKFGKCVSDVVFSGLSLIVLALPMLIIERDRYGANDIHPGLTGWAQIHGCDALPIHVKEKLDGDYVGKVSLLFDIKCVLPGVLKVLNREGAVEGGQGVIRKEKLEKVTVD